jgi:hypothetical protein
MKHHDEYTTDSAHLGSDYELTVGFLVTFDPSGEYVWKVDGAYSWKIADAAEGNGKLTEIVYESLPQEERTQIEAEINDLCLKYNGEWFADLTDALDFEALGGEGPFESAGDV